MMLAELTRCCGPAIWHRRSAPPLTRPSASGASPSRCSTSCMRPGSSACSIRIRSAATRLSRRSISKRSANWRAPTARSAGACQSPTVSGSLRPTSISLRLNDAGRPTVRTWLFPVEEAVLLDNWDPIGLRGTASESYRVEDLFVPEAFTGAREDPSLRREPGALYAFPQQTLYSVGIASVGLGIARGMLDDFVELALRKTPRGTGRLADNAVIQAEMARAEARLGAARCYLIDTVSEIYRRAGPAAPIDVMDRARARLAGSHAITNAVAVADYTYKAAGVDAIFPGSPFERRFRDLHTLAQQIQSRDAHYETVGQVLLGNPPEVFF